MNQMNHRHSKGIKRKEKKKKTFTILSALFIIVKWRKNHTLMAIVKGHHNAS